MPTVYLFVGRKNEAVLCSEFIPIIAQSLNTFVPQEIQTFRSLFQYLMELATTIVRSDYPTYSGIMLERYFRQQFAESFQYRTIGSWWEPKGAQNEIDIVALKLEKNQAVVAEVKRQKKKNKPELLAKKTEHLRNKILPKYQIEIQYLSLEDM